MAHTQSGEQRDDVSMRLFRSDQNTAPEIRTKILLVHLSICVYVRRKTAGVHARECGGVEEETQA
eukprot:6998743-Lingulodinium_polyedra.AAC.2